MAKGSWGQQLTSGLRLTSGGGGWNCNWIIQSTWWGQKTSQVVLPVSELLSSHLSTHRWWLPQKFSSYSKSHRHGPVRRGEAAGTFPPVFVLLGLDVLTYSSPMARCSKNKTATRLLPLCVPALTCWMLNALWCHFFHKSSCLKSNARVHLSCWATSASTICLCAVSLNPTLCLTL